MKAKIRVTFDMLFDASKGGECKTEVVFSLTDYPEVACPENIKSLVLGEIKMLCGAMQAAEEHIFK